MKDWLGDLFSHCLIFVCGLGTGVIVYGMAVTAQTPMVTHAGRVDSYYTPANQLIKCDRGAIQEVARICKARARMEAIK